LEYIIPNNLMDITHFCFFYFLVYYC
jgi:hypothetical protein